MLKNISYYLALCLLPTLIGCGSETNSSANSSLNNNSASTPLLRFYHLEPLTMDNNNAYLISGTCNYNLGGVTLIVESPKIKHVFRCSEDNYFVALLDLKNISSHPINIMASQRREVITAPPIPNETKRFITKWNFPTDNYGFTFPLKQGLAYNFTIDWGDKSPIEEVTSFSDEDKYHIYAEAGEYIITVTGTCEGFENSNGRSESSHSKKLMEVLSLGNMDWKDLSFAFANNINLTNVFGGNTSRVTKMSYMFFYARNVTPDTTGWDTSEVTDMSHMFYAASKAMPNTSQWNTYKVRDMSYMFYVAKSAQPQTELWNTSEVTDMSYMFYAASEATPNTRLWNTSKVRDMSYMFSSATMASPQTELWETSEVTDMSYMFAAATNAKPETSQWMTSKVIDMSYMFLSASQADPNTLNWDTSKVTNMSHMFAYTNNAKPNTSLWNTSQVTDMSYMFAAATNASPDSRSWDLSQITDIDHIFIGQVSLSSDDYSSFLITAANTAPEIIPGGKSIKTSAQYHAEAANARYQLMNRGWDIQDGGILTQP